MKTSIIPVLSLFAGLACGLLAGVQDQATQQTASKKDDQASRIMDDPAALAGGKPGKAKPALNGMAPVEKTYVIGAEDVLQIWVIEQPGISMQYSVRPDGIISVPLVGDLKVTGLTTGQVEAAISDRLKANEILKDPSVTVGIFASHSRKYYIYGEVNKPNAFDLVVPTRVSEALANAGGFKDFAKVTKIRIIREVPGSATLVFKYNDKEVSHGKKLEQNIFLEPGDRIYVD
jgi:polysaccharide biosynthesis/export protein